jgi:hypothetical protein
MKNLKLFLIISILVTGCTNKNDFDYIVSSQWEKCIEDKNCIVDFSNIMSFEWDTMCYYSGANSLEDINKDLGFELKEFTDIGDRVLFIKDSKVVYQKEWFPNPSEPTEGTIFVTEQNKFRVNKSNAKFRINKKDKSFYLVYCPEIS